MTNRPWLLLLLGAFLLSGCGKDEANEGDPTKDLSDDETPAVVQSKSFFIINEDCYGRQNGTVNRIWFDNNITYRAYRKANPGSELGMTTQYAMNYGGNIYFISKQGTRFVVADAETLQKKASFEYIGNENGGGGRSCVGVDANTVYVGSSAGIWAFDIPTLEFTEKVTGADGGTDLYTKQAGDMVRIGNRVFAVMQGKGILVIDTRTHTVETIIEPNTSGGICQSKDGLLWISGNPLKAYDPYTLEQKKTVTLPDGNTGGGVGWGAWRSCSLCASTRRNAIYWLGLNAGNEDKQTDVFRYDIDQNRLTTVMSLSSYGVIRIDPLTDYITTVDGTMYDDNGTLCRKFTILGGTPDTDGTVGDENTEYPYWFPTLPLFEDVNRPAILPNQIVMKPGEHRKICLSDMVVDNDNISQSILKRVSFESNTLLQSEVRQDTLYLEALQAKGQTGFTFEANSNGFGTKKNIRIDIK